MLATQSGMSHVWRHDLQKAGMGSGKCASLGRPQPPRESRLW